MLGDTNTYFLFPQCTFPESIAPEDAALSPPRHKTLSSHDLHSQHSHMVTSMRKIIWLRAPLSPAKASPAGAEESEGERRQRGATDNGADTSPLLAKPFLEQGTREVQRVPGVPSATDL